MALLFKVAFASIAIRTVVAQGDPEALTGKELNNPTKSWTQWQPKPTYALEKVPDQYMGANRIPKGGEPQTGFNQCADEGWNQKSQCQTAWLNSLEDFCIWGPPDGGEIGATERIAVAYCTTDKHGTRLIPDGTIKGAHFLKTPNYVQVSGVGDFTSIGIPQGDTGGEMDPHGADDLGNPIGGILFTTANPESNGEPWQAQEWTNFMSWDQFCIRACWGDQQAARCEHIYDVMGCRWNMPSTSGYTADVFETCEGDNAPLVGIYDGSTFSQGQPETPEAHPPAPSSNCQSSSSISHGLYSASTSAASAPSGGMSTAVGNGANAGTNDATSNTGTNLSESNSAQNGVSTIVSHTWTLLGVATFATLFAAL